MDTQYCRPEEEERRGLSSVQLQLKLIEYLMRSVFVGLNKDNLSVHKKHQSTKVNLIGPQSVVGAASSVSCVD